MGRHLFKFCRIEHIADHEKIKMGLFRKLWTMLLPHQRRAAVILLCLMLVGMVLETAGVGLVIPALALMTQPNLGASYPAFIPWLERIGNPSHVNLVVIGMLTLATVYAVKSLFLAFLSWWQARFTYGVQAELSERLYTGYLHQPYSFHLQRNSSELIRNTMGQVGSLTNVIQQGLSLATEVLVISGISLLLLLVEPLGALLVLTVFGAAGWVFSRFTRDHLSRWGSENQYYDGQRIQQLQQGFGGVKDVKLLGREADFIRGYQTHNLGAARVAKWLAILQALPRLWFEVLAVVGLTTLVLTMIGQGKSVDTLLPTVGLFAAAAFRLMPSANRVLAAFQTMRFSRPVIDTLYRELVELKVDNNQLSGGPLDFCGTLTFDHVSFQYQGAQALSLCDISLVIPRGNSIGIVGGSGAGKSTLVDILLGLLAPTAGSVRVDGVDIQTRLRGWQNQIGYVPQSIFLTDDTLRRNVAFGLPDEQIDEAAVWRAIRAAQLESFVKEQPEVLDTVVGERGIRLSGGQRQRIGIARALYHDPQVLVLDEATSSLDTATERGVIEAVRALSGSKTVIIVAHRLSTVEHCDRLFRLERGKLVEEGDASQVLASIAKLGHE